MSDCPSSPTIQAGPGTLLLHEHPPVYTAGRRTEDSERPLDGTPVIDVKPSVAHYASVPKAKIPKWAGG